MTVVSSDKLWSEEAKQKDFYTSRLTGEGQK